MEQHQRQEFQYTVQHTAVFGDRMNVEASFHDFSSASLFINEAYRGIRLISRGIAIRSWTLNEKMGKRKPVGNNRVEEQQPSICKLLAIAF
jgi:hypothetical protein